MDGDLGTKISSLVNMGVLILLAFGIYHRHRPRLHIPVMLSSFLIDVANVVFIEVRRGAVEKSITTASAPGEWILKLHIAVSLLSIAGYVAALITGLRLLRKNRGRNLHRINAAAFIFLRVMNYLTSFYV